MERKLEREIEREREREGYGKCCKRTTAATIEETISHQNDESDFDAFKMNYFKIFIYVVSKYKTSCSTIQIYKYG